MSAPLRVALAVEEAAGLQVLRTCVTRGLVVRLVLTTAPEPAAPARGAGPWHLARTLGLPLAAAAGVRDPALAMRLRDERIDLLLNVHALHLVHAAVIAAPRIGSFNLHPGPLPHYAGLNAPSWAVWNGESAHAATLHWMERGIDTGAIAYQTVFPLGARETGLTVSTRCVREGVRLVERLLADAAEDPGRIPQREQDPRRRRAYRRADRPEGGLALALTRSAEEAERLVRAASFHPLPSPWGEPLVRAGGLEFGVLLARATDGPAAEPGTLRRTADGTVEIAFARGWLAVEIVHWNGRTGRAVDLLPAG